MKMHQSNRLFSLVTLGVLVCILASCASNPRPYEIINNYNKQKYKRVALLVVRVGNYAHLGCPVPITLDTDYSVREPRSNDGFNLTYPGQYTAKVDVSIEDEDRLRQSLPTYPDYPLHGVTVKVKYYKNISPHIYKALSGLLTEKGYQVVNAKEIATSWPKKISEMKVSEIVNELKKNADAVLVMHYADVGYYSVFAGGNTSVGSYKKFETYTRLFEGFVQLNYTVAMFDVNTKERLMHFRSDNPFLDAIPRVIMQDPGLKGSELMKKIKTEGSLDLGYYSVDLSAAEDEVIALVMRYLCKGNNVQKGDSEWWRWAGLDEMIP